MRLLNRPDIHLIMCAVILVRSLLDGSLYVSTYSWTPGVVVVLTIFGTSWAYSVHHAYRDIFRMKGVSA